MEKQLEFEFIKTTNISMTREEVIEEIIDCTIDYLSDDWEESLRHILSKGIKGLENMSNEEITKEYKAEVLSSGNDEEDSKIVMNIIDKKE